MRFTRRSSSRKAGGLSMLQFDSIDRCQAYMDEMGIRQFDVKFCDLVGSWHHITLMRSVLDARLFEIGVGFDSSRSTLKRAIGYMKQTGIGDSFICAPEREFYLFSEASFMNEPYGAWFRLGAPGGGRT